MNESSPITVGAYQLRRDRYYDRESHLWVDVRPGGIVRCGFDPLGAESAGDIVAVSFRAPGSDVERGAPFGDLEAAKFVGPLFAPVSGTLRAHNPAVVANPALLNEDPASHWMIEIEPTNLAADLDALLHGDAARSWFEEELEAYRRKGMLAE